ncbi:uncharacterized protein LOC121766799 [Salvia splendens]|uniref:uncharacterized protein LOC121766799 n=1 Tax=Salvia splendens TaxID=180675 RepID=UPI001C25BBA9|nr:uncharacterized protein LOC121766799 [Salvia splendens]
MAPFVTCLTNLSKAITTSTIKVRCVCRYEGVPEDKNDNNLECVLHDNEGTRIQASFTNNIMQKMAFQIREGGVFYIKNFLVQSNTLKNKATNHQFRLVMNSYTEIFEVKDLAFPRKIFSFKPFPEILQMRHYDDTSFFGEMRISTHFQASKVLINPKLDEVTDFRKRIEGDERFIRNGSLGPVGPNMSSEFDNLTVKSLEDLECLEDGLYWIFGKIVSVESHYDTWYYMSCKTCFKKVEAEDNKFYCSVCKSTYSHAYRRHKFIVNIVDDTSNTSVLVWDRKGIQLIGKKVYEFVGADNQVLPIEDIAKEIEKKLVGQITPLKLGSQEAKRELKLSDLIFGSDLSEVSQKSFVTPDLSSVTNEINHECNIEGSVKRCLENDFNSYDDIFSSQKNKNKKVNK